MTRCLQAFRKQRTLPSILTKRFISSPAYRAGIVTRESRQTQRFHTAWVMRRRTNMSAATAAFPESSLGYHFAIP
jgi:hypothetical protein